MDYDEDLIKQQLSEEFELFCLPVRPGDLSQSFMVSTPHCILSWCFVDTSVLSRKLIAERMVKMGDQSVVL